MRFLWFFNDILHHSNSASTSRVGSITEVNTFRMTISTPPPRICVLSFLWTSWPRGKNYAVKLFGFNQDSVPTIIAGLVRSMNSARLALLLTML